MTATLSNGNLLLQRNLVKNANLELNFLFSAENFKKYKPDLSVYLGAAETLKIKPAECALVASHKNDLKAASSAGFFTIFIKREKEYGNYCYKFPNTNFSADVEIDSLEKLSKELR